MIRFMLDLIGKLIMDKIELILTHIGIDCLTN